MGELERMEPLFAAVEQAGDALVRALQDAINAVPPDQWANGVRYVLGEAIDKARSASLSARRTRSDFAEHDRPKGPMVTICSPDWRTDKVMKYTSELAAITSGSLVMRNGDKYSRKTGQRISNAVSFGARPYVTRKEIDRVLALKREPPAKKKETR